MNLQVSLNGLLPAISSRCFPQLMTSSALYLEDCGAKQNQTRVLLSELEILQSHLHSLVLHMQPFFYAHAHVLAQFPPNLRGRK